MAFAAAHRGLSDRHPENTVAAFKAAVDVGFRCLELDLRITADGEVVAIHDAGIDRTTDGNGRVADMQYDELRTYDTGEGPVPRFEDILDALDGWDGFWNVEIKATAATEPALELARHHGIFERMQLSSMDPRALALARTVAPDVPRGLIVLGPPDSEDLTEARKVNAVWINVDADHMDAGRMGTLVGSGFKVGAWTVNDPVRAQELIDWGARCIITDTDAVLDRCPDAVAF